MRYVYGMKYRGFSVGAQPMKGIVEVKQNAGKYHNILCYARKLTDKEIEDYELEFIKEYDELEEVRRKYDTD